MSGGSMVFPGARQSKVNQAPESKKSFQESHLFQLKGLKTQGEQVRLQFYETN